MIHLFWKSNRNKLISRCLAMLNRQLCFSIYVFNRYHSSICNIPIWRQKVRTSMENLVCMRQWPDFEPLAEFLSSADAIFMSQNREGSKSTLPVVNKLLYFFLISVYMYICTYFIAKSCNSIKNIMFMYIMYVYYAYERFYEYENVRMISLAYTSVYYIVFLNLSESLWFPCLHNALCTTNFTSRHFELQVEFLARASRIEHPKSFL